MATTSGGATFPTDWSSDGRYVAYARRGSGTAASLDLWASSQFQFGTPAPLFMVTVPPSAQTGGRHYAVTRDGQRFLVNVVQQQAAAIPLTVLVDWPAAVQKAIRD